MKTLVLGAGAVTAVVVGVAVAVVQRPPLPAAETGLAPHETAAGEGRTASAPADATAPPAPVAKPAEDGRAAAPGTTAPEPEAEPALAALPSSAPPSSPPLAGDPDGPASDAADAAVAVAARPAADAPAADAPAADAPAADAPVADSPAAVPAAPAEPVAEPSAEPGDAGPAFDVVRIEADGAALVAGRARPGDEVSVLLDAAVVATVRADAAGRFVALFTLAPDGRPRVMTLRATGADGAVLASADRVLVAPILGPAAAPRLAAAPSAATGDQTGAPEPAAGSAPGAAPAPAEARPDAATDSPARTAVAGHSAGTAGASPSPASEAVAPAAILLGRDGTKVLQSAAAAPGSGVSIDTISYSTTGEVRLAGRGEAEGTVRLYLDNRALFETGIAADGTWGGTLPAVAAGVYTLRADQLSAQGRVTSRYETPFQREDPAALQAPPDIAASPGQISVTVQPGFTLWRIARDSYGDGLLFVRVYDANRDLIRDPDLIYPGQVFALPQAE